MNDASGPLLGVLVVIQILEYTFTISEDEVDALEEKLLLFETVKFCFVRVAGKVFLKLYLSGGEEPPDFLGSRLVEVKSLKPSDWLEEAEEFQQPFELVDGVVVDPTDSIKEGDGIVLRISPGLAFGTGRHVTTKMAARLLCRVIEPGMHVLDLGCGTGILAILAARLGAERVVAVDNDPLAVQKALEEVEKNRVDVNVVLSDAFDKVEGIYDVIVSNMYAEILLEIVKKAKNFLYNGGYLILSGILREKSLAIANVAQAYDYELIENLGDGEWCAMLLKSV